MDQVLGDSSVEKSVEGGGCCISLSLSVMLRGGGVTVVLGEEECCRDKKL